MLETATTHTCYWWIKIPDWDKGTEQSVCTWKGLIFCNCNLKYFRIVHHPNYKFLFKVIIVLCRASGNLCRHCGTNASNMASTNVQFKPPDRYGGWCLKAIFFAHQANNTAKPNVKGPSGGNKKCQCTAEVPGSLVPEPKVRDSRFKSRLGTGLGIDIRAM